MKNPTLANISNLNQFSTFDGNFPTSMKTFQLLDLANYTYALFAT